MTVLLVEDLQQITIEHFFNASGYSARKLPSRRRAACRRRIR
jgi:hypothetical protein